MSTTAADILRADRPARPARDKTWLLALPGPGFLGLAYALPLAILLFASFRSAEGLSLQSYLDFFADPYNRNVLGNTLSAAFWTTLFSLLIGYPTAFALARARGWLQNLLLVCLILPLSVGVVVKAFSWTILLRSDGVLNQGLMAIGLIDEPVRLIFTETGLIFGAVNVFLPFMILPIYSVIRLHDPRLEEAAATLGAGPVYRFFHVTWPLTLPGVITGIAFVFSLSIAMYVVPTLLMGERSMTLSRLIARSYLYLRDETLGSTVAVVLLAIAVLVIVVSQRLARRADEAA
jgi:putative spermidine/putrescine transport system permease protein